MALRIETFSNVKGGDAFFKAVGHPLALEPARALVARLAKGGPVAIYDPLGLAEAFASLHDLSALTVGGLFVQDVSTIGTAALGRRAQPISDLPAAKVKAVLVLAFDAARLVDHIRHLVPAGAEIVTLDAMRLPADMLVNTRQYLDPLNFATNFAFFRDGGGRHTRVVTANYWAGYGAKAVSLWLCLFGADGAVLAKWREVAPSGPGGIAIDSREVRRRFGLGEFTGQLFIHVIGAVGHDVVKYALDVFGDRPDELSCTHDANAWPSDYYAGLPAPKADEKVVLWVQNSHPCPIPARSIGLNLMGRTDTAWLEHQVPAFGSHALDVAALLPAARWPQQIEIQAGRHFVRPRYEVIAASGRRRIAHPNVERVDLKPDPQIPELANLMGKGFILPAPVLPPDRYRSILLPTPMARSQANLPVAVKVYDASGREAAATFLGRLPRDHARSVDVGEILNGTAKTALPSGYGHMELVYDFRDGGEADGWLHALFRYEDRKSSHAAETSFGAHIFNTALTYKNEPQSYIGRPPGLSTRLFLRLGTDGLDTMCHLIYPASTPWHATSSTKLQLNDRDGAALADTEIKIACSGSLLWRASDVFGRDALARAGEGGYVLIRDTTCRLFGYHGLVDGERSFSLDHMFGF
ncbi:MAG TPA: hypothetical protein VMQ11_20210 [Alphaproteobacteria bacterium]|nr:hypothetical protein [Alphaproteobacteria bacterium]